MLVMRREYLDALPIAAAILGLDDADHVRVEHANDHFWSLAGAAERNDGRSADDFLKASGLAAAVANFLHSDVQKLRFEGDDGHDVGGRHFEIGFGRLGRMRGEGALCLISLNDITAHVETERNLRGEMLRDNLTGLSNRAGFNHYIEGLLEDSNFVPDSYAVLMLDMMRFSRVNECVGAIAGDELLITFARRLFSSPGSATTSSAS